MDLNSQNVRANKNAQSSHGVPGRRQSSATDPPMNVYVSVVNESEAGPTIVQLKRTP